MALPLANEGSTKLLLPQGVLGSAGCRQLPSHLFIRRTLWFEWEGEVCTCLCWSSEQTRLNASPPLWCQCLTAHYVLLYRANCGRLLRTLFTSALPPVTLSAPLYSHSNTTFLYILYSGIILKKVVGCYRNFPTFLSASLYFSFFSTIVDMKNCSWCNSFIIKVLWFFFLWTSLICPLSLSLNLPTQKAMLALPPTFASQWHISLKRSLCFLPSWDIGWDSTDFKAVVLFYLLAGLMDRERKAYRQAGN